MRVAIKFAYDGTYFHGYQRQPDVRTVEGEIIESLRRARIVDDVIEARFRSGSRTDKGVSAIGNVLAFNTDFSLDEIVPAHNAYSRNVWFHSIAEAEDDFNPRTAAGRWYRYHLRRRKNIDALSEAARVFVGEYDFRSFSKDRGDTQRIIDSVAVQQEGDFTIIDIKGHSFLWQMVRKMVSAMEQVEHGDLSLEEIERALQGEEVALNPAPPEPLFLVDVFHDVEFRMNPTVLRGAMQDLGTKLDTVILKTALFENVMRKMQ